MYKIAKFPSFSSLTTIPINPIIRPFPVKNPHPIKPAAKGEAIMKKKRSEESSSFTNSQVGVLIEEIDKRYVLLAEGQSDLKKEIGLNRQTIGKTLERVTNLDINVSILKNDVSVLKSDVTVLKSDVTVLKSDVTELKSDMKDVKSILGSHGNRLSRVETAVLK